MVRWYCMAGPDTTQPLRVRLTPEGLMTDVPRSVTAQVLWTLVPPDDREAVVVVQCASPEELAVWMIPHAPYAIIEPRDHPLLAWQLYHTAVTAPSQARMVVDPGPDPMEGPSTVPPLRVSHDQTLAKPDPVLAVPEAAPLTKTRAPEIPKAASSFWGRATPPIDRSLPNEPLPPEDPPGHRIPAAWTYGWVMQAAPDQYTLWRYHARDPEWLRQPTGALLAWRSLQEALAWTEEQMVALLYWTPAAVPETAVRTSEAAPDWYIGQLARRQYCLWRYGEDHQLWVLADARQRLLVMPSAAHAAEVGRQRGRVALYTPSGVWRTYLEAQVAERASTVNPPLSL